MKRKSLLLKLLLTIVVIVHLLFVLSNPSLINILFLAVLLVLVVLSLNGGRLSAILLCMTLIVGSLIYLSSFVSPEPIDFIFIVFYLLLNSVTAIDVVLNLE